MYDIVIIGGGISGLYFLHKMHKKYPKDKIILYEKSEHIGGKLKTQYDESNSVLYECGPWRISAKHKYMIQLCKDLDISLEKICFENFYNSEKYDIKPIKKDENLSGYDSLLFQKDKNYADEIENKCGYNELLKMSSVINAYDVKKKQEDYYYLQNGFSTLIQRLSKPISNFIKTNCLIKNIEKQSDDLFHILIQERTGSNHFSQYMIHSKIVILAIPSESIEKIWFINQHIEPLLASISPLSLNHIYAFSERKPIINNKLNFHMYTNNSLSQIISSVYHNKWFQISYSAGKIADYWNRLCLGHSILFKKKLDLFCKQLFHFIPIKYKNYYWENAIHYWKPSFQFNLQKSYFLSLYPNPSLLKNLYIIGESFSKNQGWCEGSLETVYDLIEILTISTKLKKTSLPKSYIIYKNRVLNIDKWIHHHPGGYDAIKNHLNQDITELWNSIHNSKYSLSIILSLQIGWIINGKYYSFDSNL
jgi:protoporphyrinogen oxidase